jgi:hypothetical protein
VCNWKLLVGRRDVPHQRVIFSGKTYRRKCNMSVTAANAAGLLGEISFIAMVIANRMRVRKIQPDSPSQYEQAVQW